MLNLEVIELKKNISFGGATKAEAEALLKKHGCRPVPREWIISITEEEEILKYRDFYPIYLGQKANGDPIYAALSVPNSGCPSDLIHRMEYPVERFGVLGVRDRAETGAIE